MGFGGGGSGSFVLPNHTHTNVLADGGALVAATTLVGAATLDGWVDPKLIATSDEVLKSGTFSTTSNTFVDVTGMTVTLPNDDNKSIITFQIFTQQIANSDFVAQLVDNATAQNESATKYDGSIATNSMTLVHVAENDGQAIKLQIHSELGNSISVYGGTTKISNIQVLSI